MSADDDTVYDAFDRFLDAQFNGRPVDTQAVAAQLETTRDNIKKAAALAERVTSAYSNSPPTVRGYRILQEIGRGSMATVYLAIREGTDARVALKVLPPSAALSERCRHRFVREAHAMASLRDPNIVTVHDVVVEGDVLAYAMEWIEGPNLAEVLARLSASGDHPGLASSEALSAALGAPSTSPVEHSAPQFWLQLGVTIARALQRVHAAGFVHRDVKPANILLRKSGVPLLADFGLVRQHDSSMTRTGVFVGTPNYAPPEQLAAEADFAPAGTAPGSEPEAVDKPRVDHRADVYALGATLYECIAGAPPFTGASPSRLLRQIETVGAPPLRKAAPRAPRDLETVLQTAMGPDREMRYDTAGQFADDLARVLRLQPIYARRPRITTRVVQAARYKYPSLLAASFGAGIVLLAVLAVSSYRDGSATARDNAAAALQMARGLLLGPEVRSATWCAQRLGLAQEDRFRAAQHSRRKALALYDEVLAVAPTRNVQCERAALKFALDLPVTGPTGSDAGQLATLHPVLAEALGEPFGVICRDILHFRAESNRTYLRPRQVSPAHSLWLVGLLGYLTGHNSLSESFWRPLGQTEAEWPLVDFALARMYADDGRFGLALPRVQRILQRHPGQSELRLDLARAYLELDDAGSAMGILVGMDATTQLSFRWRLLSCWVEAWTAPSRSMDKLVALVEERPASLDAVYRLFWLQRRTRDHAAATSTLRALVERAPDVPVFRLELARVALQQGDLELYLDQARYVIQRRFGVPASLGVRRAFLDVLQLGGLDGLYAQGVERCGHPGSPGVVGIPASSWATPPFGSRQAIERQIANGM